jgi:hypothetical protein
LAVRNSGEIIAVNAKNFRKSIDWKSGCKHLAAEDICQSQQVSRTVVAVGFRYAQDESEEAFVR